jgi:hypothetical protein
LQSIATSETPRDWMIRACGTHPSGQLRCSWSLRDLRPVCTGMTSKKSMRTLPYFVIPAKAGIQGDAMK